MGGPTREEHHDQTLEFVHRILPLILTDLWILEDCIHDTEDHERNLASVREIDDLEHNPEAQDLERRMVESAAKAIELEGDVKRMFLDKVRQFATAAEILRNI